ncbi:hypothetical protein CYMTET_4504 [Cymbomonas tetramitiformis]|uniref:Uncharacterized protein n=1 Tax=Cymbomonas tetramitiformis TaxID=36881 RepID=A0AAE0H171_9CHLO|nr:hypothetical protein CYMTET_4504 [Cymbomonas tetramitiformis]
MNRRHLTQPGYPWIPNEGTRRARLFERLDPDFYAGIIDKPVGLRSGANRRGPFFRPLSGCAGDDTDPVLKLLLEKTKVSEHFIRTQKGGAASKKARVAFVNGYRPELPRTDARSVGFDVRGRCVKAKEGALHHACLAGLPVAGRWTAGLGAAYTASWWMHGARTDSLHSPALCQVYQEAADSAGGDAFATVVEMQGALAVIRDGDDVEAFDVHMALVGSLKMSRV